MRVRLDLTVDVDAQAWSDAYGPTTTAEIRKDVRDYVRNLLAACPVPMIAREA